MLFSDGELHAAIEEGRLAFDPPLEHSAVQTASIDLTLHNVFWKQEFPTGDGIEFTVDVTARVYDYAVRMEEDEIVLKPGEFVLGETAEGISLADDLCGLIEGKSGRARHGLIVHCTAPHIAPGWGLGPPEKPGGPKVLDPKRITLEIANLGAAQLKLRAGTAIAQLMVLPTGKPARGVYEGKHMSEGT
jgi:dCTP deaminase